MARKDTLISIAIIFCCVGITAAIVYTKKSKEKEIYYPLDESSPEYSENMSYLLHAGMRNHPTNPRINMRGFMCGHVPVAHEREFPWFKKKLKEEFYYTSSLFHRIIVGGKTTLYIDRPLLEVTKKVSSYRLSNIEIAIVAPVRISSDTKEILEKRGLQITIVENPPN